MIELIELENGDLEIKVINRKEFRNLDIENDERDILYDLLDESRYIGNGWESPVDIGLTESPIITFGTQYADNDSDEVVDYDKMWFYPDYMVKSYLEELKKYNFVIFKKVKNEKICN